MDWHSILHRSRGVADSADTRRQTRGRDLPISWSAKGHLVVSTAIALLTLSWPALAQSPQDPSMRGLDADAEEQWAYSVGLQNYVFGLPLTIFERERKLRLDPVGPREKQRGLLPLHRSIRSVI